MHTPDLLAAPNRDDQVSAFQSPQMPQCSSREIPASKTTAAHTCIDGDDEDHDRDRELLHRDDDRAHKSHD